MFLSAFCFAGNYVLRGGCICSVLLLIRLTFYYPEKGLTVTAKLLSGSIDRLAFLMYEELPD